MVNAQYTLVFRRYGAWRERAAAMSFIVSQQGAFLPETAELYFLPHVVGFSDLYGELYRSRVLPEKLVAILQGSDAMAVRVAESVGLSFYKFGTCSRERKKLVKAWSIPEREPLARRALLERRSVLFCA